MEGRNLRPPERDPRNSTHRLSPPHLRIYPLSGLRHLFPTENWPLRTCYTGSFGDRGRKPPFSEGNRSTYFRSNRQHLQPYCPPLRSALCCLLFPELLDAAETCVGCSSEFQSLQSPALSSTRKRPIVKSTNLVKGDSSLLGDPLLGNSCHVLSFFSDIDHGDLRPLQLVKLWVQKLLAAQCCGL